MTAIFETSISHPAGLILSWIYIQIGTDYICNLLRYGVVSSSEITCLCVQTHLISGSRHGPQSLDKKTRNAEGALTYLSSPIQEKGPDGVTLHLSILTSLHSV